MNTTSRVRSLAAVALLGTTLAIGSPIAANATGHAPTAPGFITKWKVRSVGAPHRFVGEHHVCQYFNKPARKETVSCTNGSSRSLSVTTQFSASFPVKAADVSASVGFSVMKTTEISATGAYTVPKGSKGYEWWAPVMTYRVVQAGQYHCNQYYQNRCTFDGQTTTAHANRFKAPEFEIHLRGKKGSKPV
jgi:hypothetical protein